MTLDIEEHYAQLRQKMVSKQLVARGIRSREVLEAMNKVPRHLFVAEELRDSSYMDQPLPLVRGQTISQPYIVAFMTELLALSEEDRVLEIGTGCGYQTAVLAEIAKEAYTIEIVEELARKAASQLQRMGYTNIHAKWGDGYQGWPEHSPFDAIIVTCGAGHIPIALQQQLAVGGKMVIPVESSSDHQELVYVEKPSAEKILQKQVLPVRFVPMTGEIQNLQ